MEFIMISVGGRQEYVENAMFNLSLDNLEDCREICHCTIHSKKPITSFPCLPMMNVPARNTILNVFTTKQKLFYYFYNLFVS